MQKKINNLIVLDQEFNQKLKLLAIKNNKTKAEMATKIIEDYINRVMPK